MQIFSVHTLDYLVIFSHSLSFPVCFFLTCLMFFTGKLLRVTKNPVMTEKSEKGKSGELEYAGHSHLVLGLCGSSTLCLGDWTHSSDL